MRIIRNDNDRKSPKPREPEKSGVVRISNIGIKTNPGDLLTLFQSKGFDLHYIEVNLRLADDPRSMVAYLGMAHAEGESAAEWADGLFWRGKVISADLVPE